MEGRFPGHPTGPSCGSSPSSSQGCSCMEVWVFKLTVKRQQALRRESPHSSRGEVLLLPPDSHGPGNLEWSSR